MNADCLDVMLCLGFLQVLRLFPLQDGICGGRCLSVRLKVPKESYLAEIS